jgi:hypothetical protein
MSLAMYAAPFDNELNQINSGANNDNDTPIGRKKAMGANKTQKRYPADNYTPPKENNMYSEKVNSVLQSIHNLPATSDQLGDFNPLPPPTSAGVENTKLRENSNMPYATNTPPELDLGMSAANATTPNHYGANHYGANQVSANNYQSKQYMPQYSSMYNNSGYNGSSNSGGGSSSSSSYDNDGSYDTMIEKLNYMINLLEEQKDERTNNVTEEVVLYSFLGIFIIFIVDSFARVGKYTR